jgi:hypothetical protein
MKIRYDGYNWIARLEKGEKLVESLLEAVKKENIKTAWIFGIGAASWAKIGFYSLASKQYNWKELDKDLEILSLQGNLAWEDDAPILHIHGTFSDETMQAFGGHVKELVVAGTCELFIHDWFKGSISRSVDPKTGLKMFDV